MKNTNTERKLDLGLKLKKIPSGFEFKTESGLKVLKNRDYKKLEKRKNSNLAYIYEENDNFYDSKFDTEPNNHSIEEQSQLITKMQQTKEYQDLIKKIKKEEDEKEIDLR